VNYNNYVKKLNPNVVIVHGMRSPWQVILLRWQLGNKVMIILQNHAERPYYDLRNTFSAGQIAISMGIFLLLCSRVKRGQSRSSSGTPKK